MGYQALQGLAEIRGVCDVDPSRARAFADEFGGEVFDDLAGLLRDPSIDAVDLILPHREHVDAAIATLSAGKHLMIEKPLAPTYRESRDMCSLAELKQVTFMVAENTRYVTAYVAAERLLRDGAIGVVDNARTFLSSNMKARLSRPDFWGRTFLGGGGLILDSAPHSFYLLKWLLGDIDTVVTSAARVFPLDVEVEDVAEVTGLTKGGAHFVCGFSSVSEIPHSERLELYGTKGGIIVDQMADPVVKLFQGHQDYRGAAVPGILCGPDGWAPGGWHYESILAEVADFIGSIVDKRQPLIDSRECAYAIAVVEAAYESQLTKSPVAIHAN
jgi:predicted dehydrogenase